MLVLCCVCVVGKGVSGTRGGIRCGGILLLAAQCSPQSISFGVRRTWVSCDLYCFLAGDSGKVIFLTSLSLMVFICEVGIRIWTLLVCWES